MWFILIGSYLQEEDIKVSAGKKKGGEECENFLQNTQTKNHPKLKNNLEDLLQSAFVVFCINIKSWK